MERMIPLWKRLPLNSFVEQIEKDTGAGNYGRPTPMANDHLAWTLVNHQSVYGSKAKKNLRKEISFFLLILQVRRIHLVHRSRVNSVTIHTRFFFLMCQSVGDHDCYTSFVDGTPK